MRGDVVRAVCEAPAVYEVVLRDLGSEGSCELLTRSCADCLAGVMGQLLRVGELVRAVPGCSQRWCFEMEPVSSVGVREVCTGWRVLDVMVNPDSRAGSTCSWPALHAVEPAPAVFAVSADGHLPWLAELVCHAHVGALWRRVVRRSREAAEEQFRRRSQPGLEAVQ